MKRKSSTLSGDAQRPVSPAPETIIVTPIPGRVGPLIHSVTGRVGPLAQNAAGRVGPLAQQAVERVSPYAVQVVGRVSPYAVQAKGRVSPYAKQAAVRVVPLATSAKQRGAQAAQSAVEAWGPKLDDALGRVSPAVESARGKVTDDLLPRLSGALTAAATAPVVVEATKRSKATVAAARGELTLPEPVLTQRKSSWLKRLGLVAAVGGVAAVLVKKSLGDKDADWQAARPATPYAPTRSSAAAEEDLPTDAVEPAAQTSPFASDSSAGPSATPSDDSAGPGSSSYTGEGVYVGSEPPEGFDIKGNERSMKYHTPASISYVETTAEVWFSSEEVAIENGFVRAHN